MQVWPAGQLPTFHRLSPQLAPAGQLVKPPHWPQNGYVTPPTGGGGEATGVLPPPPPPPEGMHCQYHSDCLLQKKPAGQELPGQATSWQEPPQLPDWPPHCAHSGSTLAEAEIVACTAAGISVYV